MTQKSSRLLLILTSAILLGCGSIQQIAQATLTPMPTETQTLTATPAATSTARPTLTITPNIAATAQVEMFNELMSKYFNLGPVDGLQGKYYLLEDSTENLAHNGYYTWTTYDLMMRNFILRTNVKMSTANNRSGSTGCGIVYRTIGDFTESIFVQQNGHLYYGAGDTNFHSGYHGNINNPAEFEMVLVVNEKNYEVFIDGNTVLAGASILEPSTGAFGFAVQSGSDEDFGSQCEFTDNGLWEIRTW